MFFMMYASWHYDSTGYAEQSILPDGYSTVHQHVILHSSVLLALTSMTDPVALAVAISHRHEQASIAKLSW